MNNTTIINHKHDCNMEKNIQNMRIGMQKDEEAQAKRKNKKAQTLPKKCNSSCFTPVHAINFIYIKRHKSSTIYWWLMILLTLCQL